MRGYCFTRSREGYVVMRNVEELSSLVIEAGYELHVNLGPGLLESVYEAILAQMLERKGLKVDRQKPIQIRYQDFEIQEGFRADLIVDDRLLIEIKSLERMSNVHAKQVLTYLRLMNLPLGLLINFGAPTFKEGVKRIVNRHEHFASSRLRVNQKQIVPNERAQG